jgi:hypothetical protein
MPDKCSFLRLLIASTKEPMLIMQFQITVQEIHMQIYTSWLNQNQSTAVPRSHHAITPTLQTYPLVYREHRIITNLPKGEQKKTIRDITPDMI